MPLRRINFIAKAGRVRKHLCFIAVSEIKKGTTKQKINKFQKHNIMKAMYE